MTENEIPVAAPAKDIKAAVALMQQFTMIVAAETAALRNAERGRFETLTTRKQEYSAALQQSLAAPQAFRERFTAADRQCWQEAAVACEAALQENASLIEREQTHAAALMEELRAAFRERQAATLTYGRDAHPRHRR